MPEPKIAVLLATYNGREYLPEQLATILGQTGVEVQVIVLDDGSTDGTIEWLAEQAAADTRITILPSQGSSGGASFNFFRLIASAPLADDIDYVSLADQDDLWMLDKLSRHAALIAANGYDGVSSNITAFDEKGHRTLIRKAFPQRRFDYLTESPGPGSSFLMTRRMVELIREVLATNDLARTADYHDSLIYAVARARNWKWHIDSVSTVDYRQHEHNVMGANVGRASALSRLDLIRNKWHRGQAVLHARAGLPVAPLETKAGIERMLALMTTPGIRSRWALARSAGQMRRRPRDRWVIGFLIAVGVW